MVSTITRTHQGEIAALVEDMLFLLNPEHPRIALVDVLTRLGYSRTDTLTRRLRRAGRTDLAHLLLMRDELSARAWWDLYVTAITPPEQHEADQKVSAA